MEAVKETKTKTRGELLSRRALFQRLTVSVLGATAPLPPKAVTYPLLQWASQFFALGLEENGTLGHLLDRYEGADYGGKADHWFCGVVLTDKSLVPCRSLKTDGHALSFTFGQLDLQVRLMIEPEEGFLIMKIGEVVGTAVDVLESVRINLALAKGLQTAPVMNAAMSNKMVIGLSAIDLAVSAMPIRQGPAVRLTCTSHRRFGIVGNRMALFMCPMAQSREILQTIQKRTGLPSPRYHGGWTKSSPAMQKSYICYKDVSEDNVNQAIAFATRGGFDGIKIHVQNWAQSHGHSAINLKFFPNGLMGLQGVCKKIRAAGLKLMLHTFTACAISPNDRYVTPVPDPGLLKEFPTTLARDIDTVQTFIPLSAIPDGFPSAKRLPADNHLDVQIGNEIISYTSVQQHPPYGLAGCTRGAFGTKASEHAAHTSVYHLRRYFHGFVYDVDSPLGEQYTSRIAEVCNALSPEMIFFDNAKYDEQDGDGWYYVPKILLKIYRKLHNKNVFMQTGFLHHYTWHLVSRRSSPYGYLDWSKRPKAELERFRRASREFIQQEIGWYDIKLDYLAAGQPPRRFYTRHGDLTLQEMRYIQARAVEHEASVFFWTKVSTLEDHPQRDALLDECAKWERLRRHHRFTEQQKILLRNNLEADYEVEEVGQGPPRLKQVASENDKVPLAHQCPLPA
jgi:hypothetical protein